MRLVTDYATYENVEVKYEKYLNNNNLAVSLENDELIATLTVNFGKVSDGYAFVDTNNCPWAEKFIKDNNLGKPTGAVRQSGYCIYPLYEFFNAPIPPASLEGVVGEFAGVDCAVDDERFSSLYEDMIKFLGKVGELTEESEVIERIVSKLDKISNE